MLSKFREPVMQAAKPNEHPVIRIFVSVTQDLPGAILVMKDGQDRVAKLHYLSSCDASRVRGDIKRPRLLLHKRAPLNDC